MPNPKQISRFAAIFLFVATSLLTIGRAQDSFAQAEMFYKHRLVDDAKRSSIKGIFSPANAAEDAKCRFLLARIAVDENRVNDAAELWKYLVDKHPDTEEAKTAGLLLKQWSSLSRDTTRGVVDNAIARTYFSAADFWMGNIPSTFTVDTSWLSGEQAAEFWLRKIVAEFPDTFAAESALAAIARAYIGAAGHDRYGLGGMGAWGCASRMLEDSRDAQARSEFIVMVTKAEAVVEELRKAFPNSQSLPRLQFMVAHLYWLVDKRDKGEVWLKRVVEDAKDQDTFWSHLAKLRLKNWRT